MPRKGKKRKRKRKEKGKKRKRKRGGGEKREERMVSGAAQVPRVVRRLEPGAELGAWCLRTYTVQTLVDGLLLLEPVLVKWLLLLDV